MARSTLRSSLYGALLLSLVAGACAAHAGSGARAGYRAPLARAHAAPLGRLPRLGRAPTRCVAPAGRGDEGEGEPPAAARKIKPEVLKQQFALFRRMATPYFRDSDEARRQLGGVLALTLLNSGISVLFSFVGRDFWTALSAKDTVHFYELMAKYAAALAIGTPISVQYKFQRANLALAWRAWMTERLTALYLAERNYYEIDIRGQVDNPDQRLTDDIKYFTRVSLDFFITVRSAEWTGGWRS